MVLQQRLHSYYTRSHTQPCVTVQTQQTLRAYLSIQHGEIEFIHNNKKKLFPTHSHTTESLRMVLRGRLLGGGLVQFPSHGN